MTACNEVRRWVVELGVEIAAQRLGSFERNYFWWHLKIHRGLALRVHGRTSFVERTIYFYTHVLASNRSTVVLGIAQSVDARP